MTGKIVDLYARPQVVDDVLLAFPAVLGSLLPPFEAIPADYPHFREWLEFQNKWFAGKLPTDCEMQPAEGIDAETAGRHLTAIQKSFEPKHEHKMAAVAWLASRWFVHVGTPDGSYSCPQRESTA
ncbi:hypothetical protein [Mycobacterium sp. MUNTM1]